MHIVFFQNTPHYGGAARSTVEFAQQLKTHAKVTIVDPYGISAHYKKAVKAAGIAYRVVCPDIQHTHIGGKNIFSKTWKTTEYLLLSMKLAHGTSQLFSEIKPDIICTYDFKSAMVLAMHPKLRSIPCCYYLHNWYRSPQMTRIGRLLCKYHAKKIIGVSYSTLQAVVCAGIPANKVYALWNPIDTGSFQKKAKRPLTSSLPNTQRFVRLLVPAGILPIKGQEWAIRAMPLLIERGYDIVLWLAGDNQSNIPAIKKYKENLETIIKKLKLNEHAFFLGYRDDIPQVMSAATHLLLPSDFEGHPRVILEGMTLEKPWVVSPAGGNVDMVTPGLTGHLTRFQDPEDLALQIDHALKHPSQTKEMASRAKKWVGHTFTPEKHIQLLLTIFKTATIG